MVYSRGPAEPEDDDRAGSLQGFPLVAACKRVISIFSEEANRTAIKAELSLSAAYYMRGIAFDPQESLYVQATPQPLGTVYRDTSIEYRIIVIDITELNAVRYGVATHPLLFPHLMPGGTSRPRPVKQWEYNSSARLFSFSSAPASLSETTLTSTEISPIPAESFALRDNNFQDEISPKIRDLSLDGWTVLLISGKRWDSKASTEELRKRLDKVDEHLVRLAQGFTQPGLYESAKPVDVLTHEEAADMLLAYLKDARGLEESLRKAMEENPGGQRWYPELLHGNSDIQ
ncbi:hypothetical protein VTL71DRAFT_10701 [Oculimacula yallundae]|uniref:Uncharacterized protein n=1 Tax=Oculimacula yallundae TaxID=86028 RepID=A0ABR4CU87_9HELO